MMATTGKLHAGVKSRAISFLSPCSSLCADREWFGTRTLGQCSAVVALLSPFPPPPANAALKKKRTNRSHLSLDTFLLPLQLPYHDSEVPESPILKIRPSADCRASFFFFLENSDF